MFFLFFTEKGEENYKTTSEPDLSWYAFFIFQNSIEAYIVVKAYSFVYLDLAIFTIYGSIHNSKI